MDASTLNAISYSARKSPAIAGREDGFETGLMTKGKVKLTDHADRRWFGNPHYKAAFKVGFRKGRAERRWQEQEA